jgi:hypothetical protein
MQCYNIKGDEEDEPSTVEEEEEIEEETDEITALEKDTARALQKIDPKNKLITPKIKEQNQSPVKEDSEKGSEDVPNPPEDELTEEQQEELLASQEDGAAEEEAVGEAVGEESEGESTEEVVDETDKDASDEEGTELVFEDEEGNAVEDVAGTLDKAGDIKAKGKESVEFISAGDNSIPEDIEDLDISLGIVYVVIAIGSFFKKIEKYEENILEAYVQLDDNELDVRKDRMIKIRDITTDFLEHAETRLQKINKEELELKANLLRLTVILAQTDAMKAAISTNTKRLRDMNPEVDKIYTQTRKSVHEVNLELLRLRDQADEILSNYHTTIKELMEL